MFFLLFVGWKHNCSQVPRHGHQDTTPQPNKLTSHRCLQLPPVRKQNNIYFCFLYLLKIRTFKHYLECKLVRSAAWQQEEIHIDKPCAMSIQWHECCHHVWKNGKIEWRIAPSPRRGRKLLPMSHRQCFAPHPEQSQKTRPHPFGLSHARPTLVY